MDFTLVDWGAIIICAIAAFVIVFLAGYRYAERNRPFGEACIKCNRGYKGQR